MGQYVTEKNTNEHYTYMEKFNFSIKNLPQLNCKMFLKNNDTLFLWENEDFVHYYWVL